MNGKNNKRKLITYICLALMVCSGCHTSGYRYELIDECHAPYPRYRRVSGSSGGCHN